MKTYLIATKQYKEGTTTHVYVGRWNRTTHVAKGQIAARRAEAEERGYAVQTMLFANDREAYKYAKETTAYHQAA